MQTEVDPALKAAYEHAEERLLRLRADVRAAGSPCRACRHGSATGLFSWSSPCRHPFVSQGDHDPVSGRTRWSFPTQDKVRAGLCGAEGKLFEPASPSVRITRWMRDRGYVLLPAVLVIEAVWIVVAR